MYINSIDTSTTNQIETKPVLLSKKGMKELRKSISQLEQDRQIIRRSLKEIDKTTGHDDRFERNEKLLRLESIEAELVEKQQLIHKARLISSRRVRARVALGSVVDLIDEKGRLFRYTLVDSVEANPSDGRISTASPLGSQLIGKTTKDTVEWGSGPKSTRLQLVNVS